MAPRLTPRPNRRAASTPDPQHPTPDTLVWGRRPVAEAARAGRVKQIWLLADAKLEPEFETTLRAAWAAGVYINEVDRRQLDQMAAGANHQGVIAEVAEYEYAELADMVAAATRSATGPALLLVLDHLQDPQNVGTLLRTAEVCGVHGVILPRARAVEITPAVVKASAGATEHLTIARVANLARTIEDLKAAGIWTICLDGSARQRADQTDLTMPIAIVVGSEGDGVSRLVHERCDMAVALPMRGKIGSLNAAVAGSIALYEATRQRLK